MELNYKHSGTGEPLIILHGLFGMLDNWQSFANYFSSFFEVFNVDARNHGRSPHSDIHNFMAMATDIHEFLHDQNIFSVNIMGHSMGGKTAMQFAALYPGYVKKLVIVDVLPVKYEAAKLMDQEEVFLAAKIVADNRFINRKSAEEELIKHIHDQRTYFFMLKNLLKKEDGTIGWKFNLKALSDNYEFMIDNIYFDEPVKTPTLFIKGEKSNYITENDFAETTKYFPNARLVTIPAAGHWVHVDNPEKFKEEVMIFLSEVKRKW